MALPAIKYHSTESQLRIIHNGNQEKIKKPLFSKKPQLRVVEKSEKRILDYFAFGFEIRERSINFSDQNFGWNGQEKDDEKGNLSHYHFAFREYNPAIGRMWSVDPLRSAYVSLTPYQVAGNTPIWARELEGLEPDYTTDDNQTYSTLGPTVTVTGTNEQTGRTNSDYSIERYEPAFESLQQWQSIYGCVGCSQQQSEDFHTSMNPDYGAQHAVYVQTMDRLERERIALEKMLFFTAPFKAIEDVAYVLPGGSGVGLSIRSSSVFGRYGFNRLSGKIASLMEAPVKEVPLLAPLSEGFVPYASGFQYSFREAGGYYYRVSTLGSSSQGGFLTKAYPKSPSFAREGLALPPFNNASGIQRVYVPNGVILQRSRALGNRWGRGGLEQFEILNYSDRSRIIWGTQKPFGS